MKSLRGIKVSHLLPRHKYKLCVDVITIIYVVFHQNQVKMRENKFVTPAIGR